MIGVAVVVTGAAVVVVVTGAAVVVTGAVVTGAAVVVTGADVVVTGASVVVVVRAIVEVVSVVVDWANEAKTNKKTRASEIVIAWERRAVTPSSQHTKDGCDAYFKIFFFVCGALLLWKKKHS